jgi:hypothetical protein
LIPQKGVVQTKSVSTTDEAYIFSNQNTAYTVINGTELTITTRGGSLLDVQFTAEGFITLDPLFSGLADWWVSLLVASPSKTIVGNVTNLVDYYNEAPDSGYYVQIPVGLSIQLITGTLPAGSYNVTVQWKSGSYSSLSTYLDLSDNIVQPTRDLVAQEIVP